MTAPRRALYGNVLISRPGREGFAHQRSRVMGRIRGVWATPQERYVSLTGLHDEPEGDWWTSYGQRVGKP